MARLYTLGAEEDDINLINGTISSATLSEAQARTGQRSYLCGSGQTIQLLTDANPTEIYFGGAFYITNYAVADALRFNGPGTVVRFQSGGVVATVNPTQTSAGGTINVNTWHYLEVWLKPLNSGGRMVLKIDGTTIFDFTGDTTNSSEFITSITLMGPTSVSCYWDDVVINDASGGDNNTYPGQVRLLPIFPRAAGDNTDWDRAGIDYANNFSQARMGGGLSNTYAVLQSDTTDDLDQYLMDVPDLPGDATIKNVIAQVAARIASGSGKIRVGIEAGGTLAETADQTLSAAFKYYQLCKAVNPGTTSAWTESDLSAVQMGVKAR